MSTHHLVRVGAVGHVGRFKAVDAVAFRRGARVICRTVRGLEVGEVLAATGNDGATADGALLRGITVEDELLLARLEKNRDEAYQACSEVLVRRGIPAVLMDVEQLFDGRTLYFYFLGDVTPELEALTGELAEEYEAKVQFRKFTEAVLTGCGPDCGTDAAAGCGSSCSTCAVAGACATKKVR